MSARLAALLGSSNVTRTVVSTSLGSAGRSAASAASVGQWMSEKDAVTSSVPCPDGLLSLSCSRVILPTESSPVGEIGGLGLHRGRVDEVRVGEGSLDDRDPGAPEVFL